MVFADDLHFASSTSGFPKLELLQRSKNLFFVCLLILPLYHKVESHHEFKLFKPDPVVFKASQGILPKESRIKSLLLNAHKIGLSLMLSLSVLDRLIL